MKQECKDLIGQTLGRKEGTISDEEGEQIIAAFESKMQTLSKRKDFWDRWGSMTQAERIQAAGGELAKDLQEQAQQKKAARYKQVLAQNRSLRELDRLAREEDIHAHAGVAKLMLGVERAAKGIQNEYLISMLDTLNGIRSKWLGFVENAEDARDFAREVYGEDTKNARAKAAAEAWAKTAKDMRGRALHAGAKIGLIDYGYIPQSHDWAKVRNKKGGGKNAWIDEVLPLLDRNRYKQDNGRRMTESQLRDFLGEAWEDIVTSGHGADNLWDALETPVEPSLVAYKQYPHRELHFKDADSYLQYEAKYGQGSLTSTLIGHVSKMSHDIAMMEGFGPQAETTFKFLKEIADAQALDARREKSSWELLTKYSDHHGLTRVTLDEMWRVLSGEASAMAVNSEPAVRFLSGWRNLEIAGKLGKAFISSFSDIATYFVATGFSRLDFGQGMRFLFSVYGSDWKDYANRCGLIADSISSDFIRWGSDNLGQGWTAKLANASMKASFLTAWTDAVRRAFNLNMLASLGKLIEKDWSALDDYDRARLQDGGIGEAEWRLMQEAGTEEFKGVKFLSYKRLKEISSDPKRMIVDENTESLASKVIGFILNEGEMASLNPDLITRTEASRGNKRGTMSGELWRAAMLFKSFPLSMMEKHWRRAQFLNHHGSWVDQCGYLAAMVVSTTVMGALSLQIQDLLNGKDAEDVFSGKFWAAALTKGGGLGFLGDWIVNGLSDDSRYGAMSGAANILGPQLGSVIEASDAAFAWARAPIYDKDTKPGAKTVRSIRSHLPFLNMWYTSTAIDRAFMNEFNEWMSPGYLSRMEKKLRRGTGQDYWLPLDSLMPERAPRMADQPRK